MSYDPAMCFDFPEEAASYIDKIDAEIEKLKAQVAKVVELERKLAEQQVFIKSCVERPESGDQFFDSELLEPIRQCHELNKLLAEDRKKAVPEGWKLVPIDPTKEMFIAARNYYFSLHQNCGIWPCGEAMGIYATMLSTAPQPEDK